MLKLLNLKLAPPLVHPWGMKGKLPPAAPFGGRPAPRRNRQATRPKSKFLSASLLLAGLLGLLVFPVNAGAISFVNAYAPANGAAASTTVVLNVPTGTANGDVMIAFITLREGGTTVTITAPTGWTGIPTNQRVEDSTKVLSQAAWYRVAASEPASYTWTLSTSEKVTGAIATYRGVNNTTPIDVDAGQANASSTSITAPTITTSSATDWLVGLFGLSGCASGETITAPTGFTNRVQSYTSGTASLDAVELSDSNGTVAQGATGTKIATGSCAAINIGHLIALNQAPAAKLAFTTQPGNGTGGVNLTTQPVVTVQDAGGNTVPGATNSITLAIGTNPGGGTLTVTTNPLAAVSGVATFAGVKIDKAGTGYTLTATATGLTTATSTTFNITVGPAAKLAFTTQPGNGTGGFNLATQPVVTVQDAGGNTVTTATNSITLAIGTNPGGGTLSVTTNPLAATAGVATFAGVQINNAGTGYTLTATASGLTTATSGTFNIVACAVPSDATSVAANAQPTQAIVYWASANPVVILQRTTTAFTTEAPASGTTYTVGNTGGSLGTATVAYVGSASGSTISGLTNGTTYYYKVFANSSTCYAPGVQVVARPAASSPAWSYNLAGGSTLVAGIAGTGTIYTGSNASQIIGLSTATGTQLWTPAATQAAIQGWLTWLPTYGGWPYRKTITINHTKVTAALTNFPVLISITDTGSQSLQTLAQASGNDIFFTLADGATKLPHEIETFTKSTGQLVAWVQVPSLSNTTDTVLYMYYGNATAPAQQNVTGTWDANYKAVWHLKESGNGTAGEFKDSTGVNNGQGGGGTSTAVPTQAAGEIGYGETFDGVNDYIQVPNNASLNVTTQLTMEAWVNITAGALGNDQKVVGMTPIGSGYLLAVRGSGLTPEIWDSAGTDYSFTSAAITGSAWTHLAVTWTTGGSMIGYVNGVQSNSIAASANNIGSTTNVLRIGTTPWSNPPTQFFVTGLIDEVRISSTARSAAWIQTEYNNQSSPGTFCTVGSAQANSDAVVFGADQSGRVYTVDAGGGSSIWQVQPNAGVDYFQASVAVQAYAWADATFQSTYNDDVLFVPTRNGSTTTNKLYALKRNSGATAWSFNGTVSTGNSMDIIYGMPWVDYTRDWVYVASHANGGTTQPSLWVINSLTGALVTSFKLGDIEASPTMSVDGKTLYVGTTSGLLYAVDMSHTPLPALKWSGVGYVNLGASAAVKGFIWENGDHPGLLYFATSDGNVWSLQDPGSGAAPPAYTWKTAVTSPSTPLWNGTYLYVGSLDGKVHQLLAATGADQKQTTVGDGTKQVGDVSTETGNEIFVGTTEGTLYKYPVPF